MKFIPPLFLFAPYWHTQGALFFFFFGLDTYEVFALSAFMKFLINVPCSSVTQN